MPYKIESMNNSTKCNIAIILTKCLISPLDVMLEGAVKLPSIKVAHDKPNPSLGVGSVAWSPDGSYLATKNG